MERHRPRGSREDRRRERRDEAARGAGQTRLWVGLGKCDGLRRGGRHRGVEGLGAPAGKVVRLELRPTYAYVFVAERTWRPSRRSTASSTASGREIERAHGSA